MSFNVEQGAYSDYRQWNQNLEIKTTVEQAGCEQITPNLYEQTLDTPNSYNVNAQNASEYINSLNELVSGEFKFRDENQDGGISQEEWIKTTMYDLAESMYKLNQEAKESDIELCPNDEWFLDKATQAIVLYDFIDKTRDGFIDNAEMLNFFGNKDAINGENQSGVDGDIASDTYLYNFLMENVAQDGYLELIQRKLTKETRNDPTVKSQLDLAKWYYNWFYDHDIKEKYQN